MKPLFADNNPGQRTYIASMKTALHDPKVGSAVMSAPSAQRKVAAAHAIERAETRVAATLLPKLEELKQKGLVSSFELVPLTGALVIDVPEAQAGAAFDALRGVSELGRIVRNRTIKLDSTWKATGEATAAPAPRLTKNVETVNAPDAWRAGATGKGVVVGIVDSGVDVKHPALIDKYRGNVGGRLDHSYNYYDATRPGREPSDGIGHGTHVTGTIVGGNGIGVAPDAQFVAARVFDSQGSTTTDVLLRGLSWMLAPTDANGRNADPSKAPDLVNNSWGSDSGTDMAFYNVFKSLDTAGIVPIVAAGNEGPGAYTVSAPGSYPQSVTVAAVDDSGRTARFSSRGPNDLRFKGGAEIFKPDVAGPGVRVVSSIPGGRYQAFDGTSMASPAVAGVAALILSKSPGLSNEQVREALVGTAKDVDKPGRDYATGAGLVDAGAAVRAAT